MNHGERRTQHPVEMEKPTATPPLPVPNHLPAAVGILPPGALGVAFFHHLTGGLDDTVLAERPRRVFFVERPGGSASAGALRDAGEIQVQPLGDGGAPRRVRLDDGGLDDLAARAGEGRLPEVLLVCPNPDQLLGALSEGVRLLEVAHRRRPLALAVTEGTLAFPLVVLCANGIYFQRVRQIFIEKLEESALFGRLPDLWPDLMPHVVNRLLRGVTIQTGVREGSGPGTLYRPGARGRTLVAGGNARTRSRAVEILAGLGGWFEVAAEGVTATRLEFDKALINLTGNLLGQIHSIDERTGAFRALTVGEVFSNPRSADEARVLAGHIIAIGQAVRAYGAEEAPGPIIENVFATLRAHGGHTPSSVQYVGLGLAQGTLRAEVPPTESWLLDPLAQYARSAGLEESERYLESLKVRLVARLKVGIRARAGAPADRPASGV